MAPTSADYVTDRDINHRNHGHGAQSSAPHKGTTISQRRQHVSNIPPLQLQMRRGIDSNQALRGTESSNGNHQDGESPETDARRATSRSLSMESERQVKKRIEELSQLQSPVLRKLAAKLGEKYNLNVPSPAATYILGPGRNAYEDIEIGPRWPVIQGCDQWAGLLDPLDPVLQAEICRYGEFAQACYDCFDRDPNSKYCGSSKYPRAKLFEKVGLEFSGYEVTHYLYATAELNLPHFFLKSALENSWSKESNWIGFVAVATSPSEIVRLGRRDILVAWRGTVTNFEWIKDVEDYTTPAGFDPRHGKAQVLVENGFLSLYTSSNAKSRYNKTSAREQVLTAVRELVEKYKCEGELSITVVGHSLGSALAMLCGYDLAESQINVLSEKSPWVPCAWQDQDPATKAPVTLGKASKPKKSKDQAAANEEQVPKIPITVFSFAGPRVGNRAFKNRVNELGVAILRVANTHDVVTKIPGVLFPKLLGLIQPVINFVPAYKHVGVKYKIDHTVSPYLRLKVNATFAHNLEGYLHVVDGFHGASTPFRPTRRDFALVNKRADFLKHEYKIPAEWWQEANKGVKRDDRGHWGVPARDSEVFPKTPPPGSKQNEDEVEVESADFWHSVSIAVQKSRPGGMNLPLANSYNDETSVSLWCRIC